MKTEFKVGGYYVYNRKKEKKLVGIPLNKGDVIKILFVNKKYKVLMYQLICSPNKPYYEIMKNEVLFIMLKEQKYFKRIAKEEVILYVL